MKPGDSKAIDNATPAEDGQAQVSFLEQALWKRLNEAEGWEETLQAWLVLQCRLIAGVAEGAVLAAGPAGGEMAPVARWPEGERPSRTLAGAVDLVRKEGRGAVLGAEDGGGPALAYPVALDEAPGAIVAVGFGPGAAPDLRLAMRQLQWGAAWVRDLLRRRRAEEERRVRTRTQTALELIAALLEQDRFKDACRTAATEIALRCDCERVSVGFVRRGRAAVAAISHSAQFGKQMDLVRCLGAAMDEAIDQRSTVLYPQPEGADALVAAAHADLARGHRSGHILTVPLVLDDEYRAAFVFERPAGRPFDQHAVDLLACVAAALGPILEEKRRNDRWVVVKLGEAIVAQARRLVGPGYFGRKIALAAAALVAGFFYFAHDTYRVNAAARIEGLVRRAVVAPYDGFVKAAAARAGDTVRKGDVLAALDDRDLVLERLRWVTERQQRRYEYEQALAGRERAKIKIVGRQIAQAEAQIKLIDAQLARARLTAPFDGLVVSGDLSQSIGGAVSRGQVLFEVAPLTGYRVVLRVDESQIADVAAGQTGRVVVSSLPGEPFPFAVEKITPIAEPRDGRNVFRVEGRLTRLSSRLRPGMQGIGKIEIADRRLIWIWSRTLIDWLRIQSWAWLP